MRYPDDSGPAASGWDEDHGWTLARIGKFPHLADDDGWTIAVGCRKSA